MSPRKRLGILVAGVLLAGCDSCSKSESPDAGPRCGVGGLVCLDQCVDPRTDDHNCGGCGIACPPSTQCDGTGHCGVTCAPTTTRCPLTDGGFTGCLNLTGDPNNCGACGHTCSASQVCVLGQCQTTCDGGGGILCSGACVNPRTDDQNCGACAVSCSAPMHCDGAGHCALGCAPPNMLCPGPDGGSGTCVNLANDSANCAACGHACALSEACVAGQCQLTCAGGSGVVCGSACVDPRVDNNNCGRCGLACTGGAVCVASSCTAAACIGRIGIPGPQLIAAGYGSLLVVADLNRDGRPDVVLGSIQGGPGGVAAVLQDGTGGFRTPAIYDPGFYPYGMAVGDLLGNGNPDVVTVNCGPYTGFAQVFFNDKGDGVLAPGVVYACDGGVRGHGVAIGDINGDGIADIVVAADLPSVRIFWGDSSGSFTGPTFYDGPFATGVTVADLNGDGQPDLATGENGFGVLSVWLNLGDGGFAPPVSYSGDGDPILVADINGDGLPDLIGTDANGPCGGSFVVLLNQGSGLFSGPTRYVLGFGDCAKGVGVGDVDGDGRPDVVMSLENSGALIWRNTGDGGFEQALHPVLGNYHFGGLGLADFTGTGLPDIFLSQEYGPFSVLLPNSGDGGFSLPLSALAVGPTTLTIADVDGDGRPDVVAPGSIFFNDAGLPSTQVDFAFPSGVVTITAGDLNGDGRPDIVAGGAQLYVAINDGGAFPVVSTYPPAVSSVSALVLGDFNADGQIDVAATGANEGLVSVLLNDGTGQLRSASTFDAGLAPTAMVGVDVNGDGTLDLATVNSTGSSIAVLLGRGDGTFAPPIFYSVGVAPHAIAVGDLDGDGRPDLVVGNSASSDVSILLNSATGLLPATTLGVGINVESVQVTDLNSDGRRDIAVGGSEPFEPFGAVVLLLSDSSGGFKRREYIVSVGAPGTFNCVPPTSNLLFADFNADGRPDVAMACSGGRINVQLTSCMP